MKMIDEALKYAKAGIPVFPLHWLKADGNCSCRQGALCQAKGKHPRIKNWGDEATMIYLLRHGADDDMRLGGWSDAELSFVGIEQIRRASEKLSSGDYNIQHIFSSDLPRAKESAVIIAEKLGLHVTFIKDFRETNNGDLAGISKAIFQTDYPGLFYSSLKWDQRYPNGESPALFFTRIKNAWQSFKSEASALSGNTLLVTHGGVIDVILCLENGENYTNKRIHYHVNHAEIIRAV